MLGAALEVSLLGDGARPHGVAISSDPARLTRPHIDQAPRHIAVVERVQRTALGRNRAGEEAANAQC